MAADPAAPEISVVVLTHGRAGLLALLLDSLRVQHEPPPFEVLVVLNGDDPEARRTAQARGAGLDLQILALARTSKGDARNQALAAARGGVAYFVDDDVVVPPGTLARVAAAFRREGGLCVLGGPNLDPTSESRFQRACGILLGSVLGAGPMRRRYVGLPRAGPVGDEALILCNLAVRRERLGAHPFDPSLVCNEENLLLAQMRARGDLLVHDPDLWVRHERRPTVGGFLRQVFRSGQGRMQMTLRDPRSVRPWHMAPAALGIALALLPHGTGRAGGGLAAGYGVAVLLSVAGALLRTGDPRVCAWLLFLYPAAHAAYGIGFLTGWMR